MATNSVVTTATNSTATSLCDFLILLSSLIVIASLLAVEGAEQLWEGADSLGKGVGFVWEVTLPSLEEALP